MADGNLTVKTCPEQDTYKETFFLYTAGIGVTSVIGLFLNALNLIVLSRLKGPVSLFMLRILAFGDIIFLITCLVHFASRHLYLFSLLGDDIFQRRDREIMPLWYWVSLPPYFMALQNRNWMIVLITLERLISIGKPLWARVNITKSRVAKILVVNAIFSICLQTPKYFDREMAPSTYKCADDGEVVYLKMDWGRTRDMYTYIIFVVTVPILLLYALNMALIFFIRRALRGRSKMTSTKEDTNQNQANMMVLAMVLVFTVCESPSAFDRIAKLMGYTLSSTNPLFHYGRRIGLLLIVVDSAVNFLAYFASTRRFRRCLYSIMCPGSFADTSKSEISATSVTTVPK